MFQGHVASLRSEVLNLLEQYSKPTPTHKTAKFIPKENILDLSINQKKYINY